MKLRRLSVSLIAGALLLIPTVAGAQMGTHCGGGAGAQMGKHCGGGAGAQMGKHCGGGGPGHDGMGMWKELNLTEEQKNSLKTFHHEIKVVRQKNFEAMRAVRLKIKDEMLKANPSQSVLDGYAQEIGDLHKQMAADHNAHFLKVKTILSAEQFSKLANMMEQRSEQCGMMGRGGPGQKCFKDTNVTQ